MIRKIVTITIAVLIAAAPAASAQNFLDKVKKQAGKSIKEHVEKQIKGSSQQKPAAKKPAQQKAPAQKAPSQKAKPAAEKYVPLPEGHTAFFEPIGYPTTTGKLGGKAHLPITAESQVKSWVAAQQGVEFPTNQRLVDEFQEYEKALEGGKNRWEGNMVRRDRVKEEILRRSAEIDNFVKKLKYSKNPDQTGNYEGKDVILSFAKLLDSEMYKRTLNSSIAPLKPFLKEETIAYLESYGDPAALHAAEKTKWYPYDKIESVQTSIEGLEGYVNLHGQIDVQGLRFTIKGKEAALTEVDAINLTAAELDIPGQIIRNGVSYPVTKIGDGTFSGTLVKVIRIPNTVKSFGRYAFLNMPNLTNIEISESLVELGMSCFENCPMLQEIVLPESVKKIDNFCFRDCKGLKSAKLPSSITDFGERAFQNCSALTTVNIPEGVKSIKYYAFFGCKNLTAVNIPQSVTSIGESAFEGCSKIKSFKLHEGLLEIGARAFANCSGITELVIPNSATELGGHMTKGCKALKSVTLNSRYNNFYVLVGPFGETEIFPSSYFNTASIPAAFHFVD